MTTYSYREQADILCRYITGRNVVNQKIYELYRLAVASISTKKEDKLVHFAFKHPYLLPYLDAALVFLRPESELRRRMYTMFAILESMPEYTDLFLPKKLTLLEFTGVFLASIRAIIRILVGVAIIRIGKL